MLATARQFAQGEKNLILYTLLTDYTLYHYTTQRIVFPPTSN